ncbi:5'-3' exoribonuclease 3-like isoform X2 [Malania oleifera]|uniref:5'-3' exoribonuclease 3-like isoform X2 n=1 Tax=Malania oleifera TaxID=397392 RepID=UPI0025ADE876|nr:5'-3' exoribonuclease 3-like isoform X2 [Malania oleifera]
MGVPSFYRWLVRKYPNIVVRAIEEKDDTDSSAPNPNGGFDNLYLDMNGIIHPCFHPEDSVFPPTTFREVFKSIFEYIDRLFSIVRPRKLLYMAIDGVAPRAKMNQQRSRRFRTAKDNEIAEAEESRIKKMFEMEGKHVLPKVESEVTDSNIITPGTKFMFELSKALQSYISERLRNDSGWKDIKVILSDANVPGEGEHKIMSFIRVQRTSPDYDPNTRHCLYGLDADLIMLALATHEVHFSILREDVRMQEQQLSCESVLEASLSVVEYNSVKSSSFCQDQKGRENASLIKKPYEFMNVWTLREYLELDMKICDFPENWKDIDFERIIDDFIFLCFFAGNDFLPHMPSLEIHEGAIDLLMAIYKKEFKNIGGYLVDMQRVGDKKSGYVKLKRIEKFIILVGAYEERIFKKRSDLLERKLRRILCDAIEEEDQGGNNELDMNNDHLDLPGGNSPSSKITGTVSENDKSLSGAENCSAENYEILRKNTKELREKLKENIRCKSDMFKNGGLGINKVRLGYAGWKERYYKYKFSAETPVDIECTRKAVVEKYTEGLCWVLLYYFSGVPSWTWYYPYHYGPFASDLKGLSQVKLMFVDGLPFKPFDQLMGVLPPKSAHALPEAYQTLMTNETSNIIDFYPSDFEVDNDGKRFMWQGICKLPFIEEDRLLSETRKLEKELQEDEVVRNAEGADRMFVRSLNSLGKQILSLNKIPACHEQNEWIKIDTSLSAGISGFMDLSYKDIELGTSVSSGNHSNNLQGDDVLLVLYKLSNGHLHKPRTLEGVNFPEKTITESDIEETHLWHEYAGSKPSTRSHQERSRRSWEKHNSTSSSCENYKVAGTRQRGRGGGPEKTISEANIEEAQLWHENLCSKPSTSVAGTEWRGRGGGPEKVNAGRSMEYYKHCGTAPIGYGDGGSTIPIAPYSSEFVGQFRPVSFGHSVCSETVSLLPTSSAGEVKAASSSLGKTIPGTSIEDNWHCKTSPFGYGGSGNAIPVAPHSMKHVGHFSAASSREVKAASSSWSEVVISGRAEPCSIENSKILDSNKDASREMKAASSSWSKVVSSARAQPSGFENLKISESNRDITTHERFQAANNNYWIPRNEGVYNSDHGRAANNNYWIPRNEGVYNSDHGRGRGRRLGQGRGWGRGHEQSSQFVHAFSGQGGGRWQPSSSGSSGYTGLPYDSYCAAATPMQGHGRGHFVANTSTEWSSRDYRPNGAKRHGH